MEKQEDLKQYVIEIVEKQIAENSPEITSITFERLTALGYKPEGAKIKIAAILVEEMYESMLTGTFDDESYSERLEKIK